MNPINQLLEKINTICPLNSVDKLMISGCLKQEEYPKNSYLNRARQSPEALFFITKGLVRIYHKDLKTGEEVTDWFLKEDECIYSCLNYFTSPLLSFEKIIAEEDTTVIVICKKDLETLFTQSPTIAKILLHFAENYIFMYDERVRSLRLSAEERYSRFKVQYPKLEARLKVRDLASYLGIARSTLCMLRGKR